METDFIFLFLTLCFVRDEFRKNIELHNRNLLCPILFWSTTVRTIADTESWMIYIYRVSQNWLPRENRHVPTTKETLN
jgi:hypothetical protein